MMRNNVITLLLVAGLCAASGVTAQSVKTDLIDSKKSQHELEIMRGILGTTINFAMRELSSREPGSERETLDLLRSSWRSSNVSAFYLHGQGAVFVIPTSGMHGLAALDTVGRKFALAGDLRELEMEHAAMEAELAAADAEIRVMEAMAREQAARVADESAPPPPPSPPTAPAAPPPSPRPSPRKQQDEVRKKLERMQGKVKQRQEDAEARRTAFLEQLAGLKVHLVEALANHGDSLTHVKPNEYLNIILTSEEPFHLGDPFGEGSSRREVLSVQKSVITDYKAGRITLDGFKQKVLSYSN